MADRTVGEFYNEPGMAWSLRATGAHLHPGGEEATVALGARAAHYGFASGGRVVDIASALGAPARYLARRFVTTVICIDMDRRMHAAAQQVTRREGLGLVVQPIRARTERLPLADACCDGAWSEDALCHMDKEPVLAEVARVLRPGAVFAFTDFIARPGLTTQDLDDLRHSWAFPSLFTLPRYVAALDGLGFDILLAEDRTEALVRDRSLQLVDQELWWVQFAERWGETEASERREVGLAWWRTVQAGRAGYGMFVARRPLP